MKIAPLFASLFLLGSSSAFSTPSALPLDARPICLNEKCGYVRSDGSWAIKPKFSEATSFLNNGLAAVIPDIRINSLWGYIDTSGKLVIPAKFPVAQSFAKNGLALASTANGDVGYINDKGVFVIKPGSIKNGKGFSPSGVALAERDGVWGTLTKDGTLTPTQGPDHFQFFDTSFPDQDLSPAASNWTWGFINASGRFAITPAYASVRDFSQGVAAVQKDKNGPFGYIDPSGKFAINPIFQDARTFGSNALAPVKLNGKWGFIRKDGSFAINPRYDNATEFLNGLAHVSLGDDRALINENDQQIMVIKIEACPNSGAKQEIAYVDGKLSWPEDPSAFCRAVDKERADKARSEEAQLKKFRNTLKIGSETNCGPVVETKGDLVKVYFPVANYSSEHWLRSSTVFQPGAGCRFINGNYVP